MSTQPVDKRTSASNTFDSGQLDIIPSSGSSETPFVQQSLLGLSGSFAAPATPISHRDRSPPMRAASSTTNDLFSGFSSTALHHSIAGPSRPSHLPTPQSPGNVSAYFPGYVPILDSPLPFALSRNAVDEPEQNAGAQHETAWTPHGFIASNNATHNSSHVQIPAKQSMATMNPVTPRPHSAPFGSSSSHVRQDRVSPSTPQHLRSMHIISPPMSSASLSPENSRKGYASSFLSNLSPLGDQSPRQIAPLLQPQPTTPVKHVAHRPLDALFSPVQIADRSVLETKLYSPIFPHTLTPDERHRSDELDRVRERLALAHALDLEMRRPDYMKRQKRPDRSGFVAEENDENHDGALGIVVSPIKGRRLELFDFKQTSDESFEERLMTHGYGTYGEPRTPQNQTSRVDGLSQEAIDWLKYNTPVTARAPSVSISPEPKVELTERELKKRKRLEAFMKSPASDNTSKLYPVEVVGKGRMLLNVPPEEFEEVYRASPPKKRITGRKKKGAAESKPKVAQKKVASPMLDTPKWLDQEFPWSLREKERHIAETMEEKERLRCIERFLDRDTDSGEEDQVEEMILFSEFNHDSLPPRQGRGKAVPLNAEPDNWTHSKETVFFQSETADARVAFLSKRSIRGLTRRRRVQGDADDENENVTCLCGNAETDTDTHLVQCDDCHKWYHMRCVGIQEPEDLPREDETWYCPNCMNWPEQDLSDSVPSTPPIRREPTLVPTDDLPPSITRDIAIYQSSPQGSPSRVWQHSTATTPRTPKRNKNRSADYSSRSAWGDSSGAGPSTPPSNSHNVHVYSTPRNRLDDSSFDPTSTPTRGINFSLPFVTPKSGWMARSSGLFSTPRGGGFRNTFGDDSGFGNLPKSIYSYDDTPIRRASAADTHRPLAAQSLLDSPLAPRPAVAPFPQLEESPIVRSKTNKGNGFSM